MATLSARSSHIPLSPIRKIYNLAETIPGLIRLEIGEPDFETPEVIIKAGQRALGEGWTKYTTTPGIPALRQALAEYDSPKLGRLPDPMREICVTSGGTNAIFLALLAIINQGDEVMIPDPGFAVYPNIIRLAGGVPITYEQDAKYNFRVDKEKVMDSLSQRTRAIVITSPSNPTGCLLDLEDLEFFAKLAQERDLWVISDEVYERIVFDGRKHHSIAALPGMAERTVVVGAFSKSFCMTGWRLGHIVAPAPVVDAATRFQNHVNACMPASVQVAGIAALQSSPILVDEMVQQFQARRDAFMSELGEVPGVQCAKPQGAFYVFPDFNSYGMTDIDLAMYLIQSAKVSSVPGSSFGKRGRGFLRFSIVRSAEELRMAVRQIKEALKAIK